MTVVVWDGKTMAADKRGVIAGAHYAVTKLVRLGDSKIAGISGHLGHGLAVCAWLSGDRDAAKYPPAMEGNESYVLLAHRGGLLERFERGPHPIVVADRYHVLGGARDFALAALHLGCDARRAVEVTCALSSECGNGIDTLAFDEVPQ